MIKDIQAASHDEQTEFITFVELKEVFNNRKNH